MEILIEMDSSNILVIGISIFKSSIIPSNKTKGDDLKKELLTFSQFI